MIECKPAWRKFQWPIILEVIGGLDFPAPKAAPLPWLNFQKAKRNSYSELVNGICHVSKQILIESIKSNNKVNLSRSIHPGKKGLVMYARNGQVGEKYKKKKMRLKINIIGLALSSNIALIYNFLYVLSMQFMDIIHDSIMYRFIKY